MNQRKPGAWLVALTMFVTLAAAACGRPDTVSVKPGETCHVSKSGGWKSCEGACLNDNDQLQLKHQLNPDTAPKAPTTPIVTTESGTAGGDNYDCYGFLGQSCTLKGVCYAKVKLGEPCVGNDMCAEGVCLGEARDKNGNLVWKCRKGSVK